MHRWYNLKKRKGLDLLRLILCVPFTLGCNVAAPFRLLVQVWDPLDLVQPYLLAVTLLFLAFLFVAQLICECKATPIIR